MSLQESPEAGVDATESRSIAEYKRLEFQGGETWKVHHVPGFT